MFQTQDQSLQTGQRPGTCDRNIQCLYRPIIKGNIWNNCYSCEIEDMGSWIKKSSSDIINLKFSDFSK